MRTIPRLSLGNADVVATAVFLVACVWTQTRSAQAGRGFENGLGSHLFVDGDLTLAFVDAISFPGKVPGDCTFRARFITGLQRVEAMTFAIQDINKDESHLPGIKLGLVVLDDCLSETASFLRVLNLVPQHTYSCEKREHNSYFDVVGVVGCSWSGGTQLTALTLAPFKIPVISFAASANSLSNKEKYPNLFRLIPPDQHLTRAVMEFIAGEGWGLISVLFSQEMYGLSAYRKISELSETMGICLDGKISIAHTLDMSECREIVHQLVSAHTAKVVVIFDAFSDVMCFMSAVTELQVQHQLVWVASDTWMTLFTKPRVPPGFPPGVFVFSHQSAELPGFQDFLGRPNNTQQSWFEQRVENTHLCRAKPCNISDIMSSHQATQDAAIVYDIVHIYARAIQHLLRYKCTNVTRQSAHTCICQHRRDFMDYIQRTYYYGITGLVRFDETGSRLSMYKVLHAQIDVQGKLSPVLSATYDIHSQSLFHVERDLWSGFEGKVAPKSSCTEACRPGERKIMLGCCWICKPCKPNEIVIENNSKCAPCKHLQHPDADYEHCVPIPIRFVLKSTHVGVIFAVVLTVLGITSTQLILLVYLLNRDHIVIVSSNTELSILQTISMLMGYVAVVLFLCVPSVKVCTAAFILLPFSFNTLYAAALLKALGQYHTHRSRTSVVNMKYANRNTQLNMMGIIIFLQISLQVGLSVLAPIDIGYHQDESDETIIDVYCSIPSLRITLFLIINIFFLLLCSSFSLQTKVLPNRFPESVYVARCVSTTIITWLVFMPALNVLDHTAIQTLLLCYIVIFNLMTAALFLFGLRLYELFARTTANLQYEFKKTPGHLGLSVSTQARSLHKCSSRSSIC